MQTKKKHLKEMVIELFWIQNKNEKQARKKILFHLFRLSKVNGIGI